MGGEKKNPTHLCRGTLIQRCKSILQLMLHIPTYPTYRHRRFHIIYCKAQNRHFKSDKVYNEKVHLYHKALTT